MARLQILELPEGASDERAPFVLVIDEYTPERVIVGGGQPLPDRHRWDELAQRIGARAVLAFAETIEIPANEVPVGPDGYPLRIRVEPDLAGFGEQVTAALVAAQDEAARVVANGGHAFGAPRVEGARY